MTGGDTLEPVPGLTHRQQDPQAGTHPAADELQCPCRGYLSATTGQALDTLCMDIKDLKSYEAFMLARKITQEAGEAAAVAGILLGRALQTAVHS